MIGLGKCGARELNYASDVDVIFVAEPVEGADETRALRAATAVAAALMRICSDHTREGTLWPVDAGATAGRQIGSAGPDTAKPFELLRALGQDLGVPSVAQGTPHRRRSRAR
ncbi:MAG: hypothetical protein WKF82_10150 [Nocardioidaceae bacterium]